jgi:DNA-binding NarL/FixJ family response regulator
VRSVKVLVADPSPLLRDILSAPFSEETSDDLECAGAVGSLTDLRVACRRLRPHVVLSACDFGDGDLLEVMPELLRTGTRVLVVCSATATATEAVSALLFAGASGCLSIDDCAPSDVVVAARTVAAGHAALHPAAAAAVLRKWRMMRSSSDGLLSRSEAPTLTRREADVLQALARGLSTKTIARELSVSPKTVEAHIGRLLAKLGAHNRAHAISVARSQGLFDE